LAAIHDYYGKIEAKIDEKKKTDAERTAAAAREDGAVKGVQGGLVTVTAVTAVVAPPLAVIPGTVLVATEIAEATAD
jgi:hypothetical protein